MQSDHSKYLPRLLLPLIVLVAVGARFLPWEHVFMGGSTYFTDGDCYVRFRKILVYLHAFPKTFVYDYYEGYPVGTGIITPPIMEYLMAAIASPFRDLPSLVPTLKQVTALVPPLIGGVTVAYLYRFARGGMAPAAALTAALFLALAPPHVDATVLGRFDNEMMEPLLLLIVVSLYGRTYAREGSLPPWLLTGLASACYVIFWRGALFPLSLMGLDLLRRLLALRSQRLSAGVLARQGASLYGTAAVVIGIVCVINPWQSGRVFSYNIISLFHVSLFTAVTLLFVAISCFFSGRRAAMMAGYCFLVAGFGSLLYFRQELLQGITVVTGGDVWIDTISEYVPGFSQANNPGYYGVFGLVAPLALLSLLPGKAADFKMKSFLVLWTVVMFAATAARLRFAAYYAINGALMAGLVVEYAQALDVRRGRRIFTVAAIVLIALLQASTWTYFREIYQEGRGVAIRGDLEDTMIWLRDHTPAAGDPYRPAEKPSYGVLGRWDIGGYIETIGLRPTVATAYGKETFGLTESVRAFLAEDDLHLRSIMESTGTRYLILDDMMIPNLGDFARLLDDRRPFFENKWDPLRGATIQVPTKECLSLAFWRLLFADGLMTAARGAFIAPVEGVRLVFESATPSGRFPWQTSRYRIFEAFDGVLLEINGKPGVMVEIIQQVETNRGRRFVYRNRKVTDAAGKTSFTLPYPAKRAAGTVGAVGPVTVTAEGAERTVPVTDLDVNEGKRVTITLR